MTKHPVGHVRILVTATGETGTVDPDQPSPRTFHLDVGGSRVIGGGEMIRLLPPEADFVLPSMRDGGDGHG